MVEIAIRGGGVFTSSTIIPELTKVNTHSLLISNSLNKKFDLKISRSNNFILLHFLNFKTGKILKISGVKEILKIKNILELRLNLKKVI